MGIILNRFLVSPLCLEQKYVPAKILGYSSSLLSSSFLAIVLAIVDFPVPPIPHNQYTGGLSDEGPNAQVHC